MRALVRALKEGRVLGCVLRPERGGAAHLPHLLRRPGGHHLDPAFLARRARAAVVFVVSVPLGDGRHKVVIDGPLELPDTGDRDADDLAFMQMLNDKLEAWVRRHPERWFWLPPAVGRPPAAPVPGAVDRRLPGLDRIDAPRAAR